MQRFTRREKKIKSSLLTQRSRSFMKNQMLLNLLVHVSLYQPHYSQPIPLVQLLNGMQSDVRVIWRH